MNELIVDTSVWIEFFHGKTLPILETALQESRVILSPLVYAELLSGQTAKSTDRRLIDFLDELDLHPVPRTHWSAVGHLRRSCSGKGMTLSIPDAHVAQCAIDVEGLLYSFDAIFLKISRITSLKLLEE